MVKRIVVGAHYGLRDWLAQRVTAAVMAVYTLIVAGALLAGPSLSQDAWRSLMSGGFMRFATFLFIVCLCYHAWVGVRDIWMDYVKPAGIRLSLHVVTLLLLVGCAGWSIQILWSL
ncbi:MAG: succinate dehydrogenase, hydrophobic membrane anchor protein [Sterolibacterium sp.]|jgi:succinate dehydrogenase / fumarate reductase membrane anchor subunit